MGKTVSNKTKTQSKSSSKTKKVSGNSIQGAMRKKRSESKKGVNAGTSFTDSGFYLPAFPNTYIHSYVHNFHDQLKQLSLLGSLQQAFKNIMEPIVDHIEFLKKEAEKDYKVISASGQEQTILEYFSQPVEPLNDLRLMKDILTMLKMAVSSKIGYKTKARVEGQNSEMHWYLSGEMLDINISTPVGTREQVKKQFVARLKSSKSTLLSDTELENLVESTLQLVEQYENTDNTTAKKNVFRDDGKNHRQSTQSAIAEIRQKVQNIEDLVGNTLLEKFNSYLKIWTSKSYRQANAAHFADLKEFTQILKLDKYDNDLGFMAEVLRADFLSGDTAGDDDNKSTASDLQYSIDLIGAAGKTIQESLKFYKNDIYYKTENFTGEELIRLCQAQPEAINQLNYFLSNYFVLGQAEKNGLTSKEDNYMNSSSEVNSIYDLIQNTLKKIAFFAAVYQGGAKNSITSDSNALPMLLTVNQHTVYTYTLWSALSRAIHDPNTPITLESDLALELDSSAFPKIKEIKNSITRSYIKRGKDFNYSAYLGNGGLMSYIAKNASAMQQYRSATLGSVKVSINMAQLMNT